MTLTIHTEEDDQRQLTLTVEVGENRVQQAMRNKARTLAKDIHVPGFRKGKAPYQVIVRRVGEEALRSEVVEDMVQPIFEEVIRENNIDLFGQPSLNDVQINPMVFKFTVPLSPTAQLGDYRALRREVEEVIITDAAIAQALEQVRVRHQLIEPVDRPAAQGDLVTLSGIGKLAPLAQEDAEGEGEGETAVATPNETLFEEDHSEMLLDSGVLFPGTPFVDNIVGMSAGEEKQFTFIFAADYEDSELAGREANFSIYLLEVKSRTLPELDDELAKQEGSYETLEELRQSLHDNLQTQAESEAHNTLIGDFVDDLLIDAQIVYPPVAIEREIDVLVESLKSRITRSGWKWEDYLRMTNKTEPAVREDFKDNARQSLERQLVLRQFVLTEKLVVSTQEVEEKIARRLDTFGDDADLRKSVHDYFSSGYGLESVSNEVLTDKVVARIKAVLSGEAPDLDSLEIADAVDSDEEE